MTRLTLLLGLSVLAFSSPAIAQVSEDDIQALRTQIEQLNRRLDQLEQQNQQMSRALQEARAGDLTGSLAAAGDEAVLDEKIDQAVAEQVDERMAAVSWAERIRWKGDFRYRYENIEEEGRDGRNRSRIRARAALVADVTPTVEVGLGLATGGNDPVSANVTLGGGGSKKEINLDLAYFNWSGLANTNVLGGKFSNYLVKPQKTALLWDGDWRPEGLGLIWDNGTFFAQGLGTWLEGDSRKGTEFGWVAQAGMKLKLGATGKLMFGGGYSEFNIAGGRAVRRLRGQYGRRRERHRLPVRRQVRFSQGKGQLGHSLVLRETRSGRRGWPGDRFRLWWRRHGCKRPCALRQLCLRHLRRGRTGRPHRALFNAARDEEPGEFAHGRSL